MRGADLSHAYLKDAYLVETDLRRGILCKTCLEGADLTKAHLEESYLTEANLERAILRGAFLEKAFLKQTLLKKTNFIETDLRETTFLGIDLGKVKGLTIRQLTEEPSPYLCAIALPEDFITIEPYRNCEQIPKILAERDSRLSITDAKALVNHTVDTWKSQKS